jgi:hypothetical protein
VFRSVCARDDNGDFIVACASVPLDVDYGVPMFAVRGFIRSIMRIRPVNSLSVGSTCHVKLSAVLDAGGFIPVSLVNKFTPQGLGAAVSMQETFQRDDEIDSLRRSLFARKIRNEPQMYTLDERNTVKSVSAQMTGLGREAYTLMRSPDHFVEMAFALKEGAEAGRMRASVVIDARVEDVAAYVRASAQTVRASAQTRPCEHY